MGCDIHTITELKTADGWKAALLDKPIFDWRTYGMYAFLAGVRNWSDVPEREWHRRGWPADVTDEADHLRNRWEGSAHNHTWITLAELLAFDYDQPVEDRRITVTVGNVSNGGCTAQPGGGKMMTYRTFLGNGFFEELERLKELGKPEDVRVLVFFDN